jgi:hypothetical protein
VAARGLCGVLEWNWLWFGPAETKPRAPRRAAPQFVLQDYGSPRAHGFVDGVHELNRHQTVEGGYERCGSVNNRVDERAILLHVTPLLFARQLLHRLFREVTLEVVLQVRLSISRVTSVA